MALWMEWQSKVAVAGVSIQSGRRNLPSLSLTKMSRNRPGSMQKHSDTHLLSASNGSYLQLTSSRQGFRTSIKIKTRLFNRKVLDLFNNHHLCQLMLKWIPRMHQYQYQLLTWYTKNLCNTLTILIYSNNSCTILVFTSNLSHVWISTRIHTSNINTTIPTT